MIKKKSFTINRKKWLRGEEEPASPDGNLSYLLREDDGKMCCLGFFAKAICGLKNKDIIDIQNPEEVIKNDLFPNWFWEGNDESTDLTTLITNNDNKFIKDKVRENVIKHVFKSHGIDVKFVG